MLLWLWIPGRAFGPPGMTQSQCVLFKGEWIKGSAGAKRTEARSRTP
ncbi:hypothetical protein SS37A_24050 [Methylocystis iwaonis]|uniref:Uncharacterized protein n=1 Tax=Methylocystis iwaonis TaxID=2885079 RepID=A0ABN6VJ85_9HYPH|nr:hypothetical protein SS37A_24050 [Methylocystis iwaonis]